MRIRPSFIFTIMYNSVENVVMEGEKLWISIKIIKRFQ